MIVLLIRHAVAVARDDWAGADEGRPLTALGVEQSAGLAELFREFAVAAVLTSNQRRCWETVLPAAAEMRLPVSFDGRLADADHGGLLAVLNTLTGGVTAVCSRGEPIRGVLRAARGDGYRPAGRELCEMGSVWIVHRPDHTPATVNVSGRLDARTLDLRRYRPPLPTRGTMNVPS